MNLTSLRDRASAPLEWTARQVALHPKGVLAVWAVSLFVVALVF
jgi:hypothetical protein